MNQDAMQFLHRLLDAPGPSGFEQLPSRVWRTEAARLADEVRSDTAGNAFATLGGTMADGVRVMLAGHIDEIGVMVVHVDDEGYLWFEAIGGWDSQVLVGQRVVLLGRSGPVTGLIGKKAIHLMEKEDREKVSKISDLWIDIGARSREEALTLIRVGDAGVVSAAVESLPNGRLASRSLDNRVGAFVVLEALRLLREQRPGATAVAVATAQEEIALTGGGARSSTHGLEPACALAVDVTHATDTPGVEKRRYGDVRLGGGPVLSRGSAVSPVVLGRLIDAAEAESIPYTLQAAARCTGTDADHIATSLRGIPTGLLSIPLRYMHSPNEMVALDDIERTARLLAAFVRRLDAGADFRIN